MVTGGYLFLKCPIFNMAVEAPAKAAQQGRRIDLNDPAEARKAYEYAIRTVLEGNTRVSNVPTLGGGMVKGGGTVDEKFQRAYGNDAAAQGILAEVRGANLRGDKNDPSVEGLARKMRLEPDEMTLFFSANMEGNGVSYLRGDSETVLHYAGRAAANNSRIIDSHGSLAAGDVVEAAEKSLETARMVRDRAMSRLHPEFRKTAEEALEDVAFHARDPKSECSKVMGRITKDGRRRSAAEMKTPELDMVLRAVESDIASMDKGKVGREMGWGEYDELEHTKFMRLNTAAVALRREIEERKSPATSGTTKETGGETRVLEFKGRLLDAERIENAEIARLPKDKNMAATFSILRHGFEKVHGRQRAPERIIEFAERLRNRIREVSRQERDPVAARMNVYGENLGKILTKREMDALQSEIESDELRQRGKEGAGLGVPTITKVVETTMETLFGRDFEKLK